MDHDRYHALGPKLRVANFANAANVIREVYPAAYWEGSTGYERSWWTNSEHGLELIAHSWPVRRHPTNLWLRVKPPQAPSAGHDNMRQAPDVCD